MRYALPVVGLLVVAVLMSGCLVGSSSPGSELPYPPFRDASVIKFDPDGTVAWQTGLSFGRDTIPSSVVPMPGGGYALTGQAISEGNFSFPHPFVAMLNANGSLLWNRTLPSLTDPTAGDANDTAPWEKVLFRWTAIRTIVPAPSGGYLIGGSADGDAAIALLDESGSVLWSKILSGRTGTLIERVLPLAYGGVAVAGTADEDGRIRSSAYVARLDNDGTVLWDRTVEEKGSKLIWEISDLWEADGQIGTVYEVFQTGNDGSYETVVAVLGPDGSPVDHRTLDAFTPVLRRSDCSYVFPAFPMGDEGWFYYGTRLHLVLLDGSGSVIGDSSVDLGEGSQTWPFVETRNGGYVLAVTHGAATRVSSSTGNGTLMVSVAVGRE